MLLDSLILQTKLFLQDDMDIEVKDVIVDKENADKLVLKHYTSMIGVGGKLNLMVVISFENAILDKLVELFMDGEEVEEDEAQEVKDSVAGEVINTILGLALPTFPNRGKGVTITPPITINDVGSIAKYKNSKIITAVVQTDFGEIIISAVGSEDSIK